MHDDAPLFARKTDGTRPVPLQPLRDHLIGAAKLAQSFEKEFSTLAGTAALIHDVGKATERFQRYLLNGEGQRGSVIHAWQGAFIIDDIDVQSKRAKIVQEIPGVGHHETSRRVTRLRGSQRHDNLFRPVLPRQQSGYTILIQ